MTDRNLRDGNDPGADTQHPLGPEHATIPSTGWGPAPLSRPEMDTETGMGCADCGEIHPTMFVDPSCHSGAGLAAYYDRRDGTVHLLCAVCEEPIVTFPVARVVEAQILT